MTSLRELVESARAALPEAPFARSATLLFGLFVLTLVISLAVSEAFLIAAGLCYAVDRLRAGRADLKPPTESTSALRFPFPPIRLAVGLFCVLTILSVFGAANSAAGWPAVRKLVLFLIMLLAVALAKSPALQELTYVGLFFTSALAGIVGVFQFAKEYHEVKGAHPNQIYAYMSVSRIHGFMGHWMNFGGQQMLVFSVLLAAVLLSGPGEGTAGGSPGKATGIARWGKISWLLLGVISFSIALNFTRGVWLGCFIAVVYLVARSRPRWLLALPLAIVLAFLAGPRLVRERLGSLLHPTRDPSISIRLEMWQVALRMIRAHPWLGIGPDNVEREYTVYLPPGKSPEVGYHEHFHDNFLQLAAERGLPCLAVWLWMMAALLWALIRRRRTARTGETEESSASSDRPPPWIVEGALAAWLAFVAEGVFEFNFGTSPTLMVFLFVVSVPFARSGFPLARE